MQGRILRAGVIDSPYFSSITLSDHVVAALNEFDLQLKFERYCPIEECSDLWTKGFNKDSMDFIGELEESKDTVAMADYLKGNNYSMILAIDGNSNTSNVYFIGHYSFKWNRKFYFVEAKKLALFASDINGLGRAFETDNRIKKIADEHKQMEAILKEKDIEIFRLQEENKSLYTEIASKNAILEEVRKENCMVYNLNDDLARQVSDLQYNWSQGSKTAEIERQNEYINMIYDEKIKLSNQVSQLKERLDEASKVRRSERLCNICLEGFKTHVLFPCGDVICENCSQMVASEGWVCGLCRHPVSQILKIKF